MGNYERDEIQNYQRGRERSRGENNRSSRPNGSHNARGGRNQLPDDEINLILRGADSVIASAGRAMLSKILKGSKDKKLLQFAEDVELNQNPAYGSFSQYTLAEIMDKIDWAIEHGYLDLEYNWKLPVIIFTDKGWEIECEERAKEFLKEWDEWIENGVQVVNMNYLKGRNRGLIKLLLDKVMQTDDPKYLPLLRKWEPIDFKKVQVMIHNVIQHLESCKLEN